MLYNKYMNTIIDIHVSMKVNILFTALIYFFLVANADKKIDFATLTLLPNETGMVCLSV